MKLRAQKSLVVPLTSLTAKQVIDHRNWVWSDLLILKSSIRILISKDVINRNGVHCSQLAWLLVLTIDQAPKREAFDCRDASLTRSESRRSRELLTWHSFKNEDGCSGLGEREQIFASSL